MIMSIVISPQEIVIIDDLTQSVIDSDGKIRSYLQQYRNNHIIQKEIVIAFNTRHELIALDGNKLCFAARLAQRNVSCKFMKCDMDYNNMQFIEEAKIRNSPLLLHKALRDKYLLNQFEYVDYFERGYKMRDAEIDIPRAGLIPIKNKLGVTIWKDCLLYTGVSKTIAFRFCTGKKKKKY